MDAQNTYLRALRLLAGRAHSRAELIRKLRGKGATRDLASQAADRAASLGYLDDSEYARMYCTSAHQKGMAPSRIRQELARRGVETTLAEAALKEVFADIDLELQALSLARKRAERLSGDTPSKRRRLAAFLTRRGFPTSVVLTAVDLVAPSS